jgi:hypothetical protein
MKPFRQQLMIFFVLTNLFFNLNISNLTVIKNQNIMTPCVQLQKYKVSKPNKTRKKITPSKLFKNGKNEKLKDSFINNNLLQDMPMTTTGMILSSMSGSLLFGTK